MPSTATWIAVGVALIAIGMAALIPPAWVAYAFVGAGAIVVILATQARWFKIVRRHDD
jgi:hypothetical protein